MPPKLPLILIFCLLLQSLKAEPITNQFHFNDFLLIPLRVHLIRTPHFPNVHTTLEQDDINRILGKLNRVWAQAGLYFFPESILPEEANDPATHADGATQASRLDLLGLRQTNSLATNLFHVYYLKTLPMNGIYFSEGIFVKDTAALREVAGGLDEPIPRVTSHELGHALSLPHRQETTNLMASGTTGFWLNAEEIKQARNFASKLDWAQPAPALVKKADALFDADSKTQALRLYSILAELPVHDPRVESARQKTFSSSQTRQK